MLGVKALNEYVHLRASLLLSHDKYSNMYDPKDFRVNIASIIGYGGWPSMTNKEKYDLAV